MANLNSWFVIINPVSGNGLGKKSWPIIERLLKEYGFEFDYTFTEHHKHSSKLVQMAIRKGFRKIISVGGDGTVSNIVNGIMRQNDINSKHVNVGVIPVGTGNDWIKTHNIPRDYEKAIQIIKNGKSKLQDLGKIELINTKQEVRYFVNLAAVGFDGYVVNKVKKYKRLGSTAYFIGTLIGFLSYTNFQSQIRINSEVFSGETLMILIGLCKYSGGGMQLTKNPNPFDGLFDVSYAGDFSKWDIFKNILNLFNGKIVNYKKLQTGTAKEVFVKIQQENRPYIQADGELIGTGDAKFTLIPKSFSFYCS